MSRSSSQGRIVVRQDRLTGQVTRVDVEEPNPASGAASPRQTPASAVEVLQEDAERADPDPTLSSARPFLFELESVLEERKQSSGERSYTRSLFDGGPARIGEKLREEADELARAVAEESRDRVISEAADVLYHVLVGLRFRDVGLREVIAKLAARSGTSGHAEKAGRRPGR